MALLVERRGDRPLPVVLDRVALPSGKAPQLVRDALLLRDALAEEGSIPASQAARKARVQAAKPLIAVAPESPLHRSAWNVGGVRLAAASPTARLEALHAFRALLDDVESQAGRRVTRREAATLDAEHELALIALAEAAYTLGVLDPAVGLLDTIPPRSPRWAQAQLAAAEIDSMRGATARAAARLRPLIDPRRPKPRWGPHRVAPALSAADFTVPAEGVPEPVQEAWSRMVLAEATWLEPHCWSSDEPRPPKGAMDAVDAGLATLVARSKAWTSAFKAGQVPPAFAASLSTPATRLAAARLAAVTEDEAAAARLYLGAWTAPVAEALAGARTAAEVAFALADAQARAAAATEAADLGVQAEIVQFEGRGYVHCERRDYVW